MALKSTPVPQRADVKGLENCPIAEETAAATRACKEENSNWVSLFSWNLELGLLELQQNTLLWASSASSSTPIFRQMKGVVACFLNESELKNFRLLESEENV